MTDPTMHYIPHIDWALSHAKPRTLCDVPVVMNGPYVMQQPPYWTGDIHDVTCSKCLAENVARQRSLSRGVEAP